MPILYTKVSNNNLAQIYNYEDKYSSDAIFIFLGINDYNNFFKPTNETFINEYLNLLNKIKYTQLYNFGKQPKIIAICS
jgi:lysophospholipase L1-like esterase